MTEAQRRVLGMDKDKELPNDKSWDSSPDWSCSNATTHNFSIILPSKIHFSSKFYNAPL